MILTNLLCIILCAMTFAKKGLLPVLVLDVDGTLYESDCGVEQQVRRNYITFAKDQLGVSELTCKDLKRRFGTTIRGLSMLKGSTDVFGKYYENVYPKVDLCKLRKYCEIPTETNGYHLSRICTAHKALFQMSGRFPIIVASNAPAFHVQRVLSRIGLSDLPVGAILTPDKLNFATKYEATFWEALQSMYPPDQYQCTLVDDNQDVLKLAESMGIRGLQVTTDQGLSECLVEFILNITHSNCKLMREYGFDDNRYLTAKNALDSSAINVDVLDNLRRALQHRMTVRSVTEDNELRILDLGAGHLSMLPVLLSQLRHLERGTLSSPQAVHYIAVESNERVLPAAYLRPQNLGLTEQCSTVANVRRFAGDAGGICLTVDVCAVDYMSGEAARTLRSLRLRYNNTAVPATASSQEGFDLIVGACMADLHNPKQLLHQIIELAGDAGGLLYLPLTFNGSTALRGGGSQQLPVLRRWESMDHRLASDVGGDSCELVLRTYHEHLRSLGHFLCSGDLLREMHHHGCTLLCEPLPSDWTISSAQHPYLWCSLLHFIMQGTTFDFVATHDISTWWRELLDLSCVDDLTIEVNNVDILAELPRIHMKVSTAHSPQPPTATPCGAPSTQAQSAESRRSVLFTAAREVHVIEERVPALGPLQLRIRTHSTLVSTGTERKVFRGDLCVAEHDSVPLDATLQGMQGSMRYPLRYGYSLVGVVEAAGSAVENAAAWVGKRVFAFAPHITLAVVDAADVLVIPDDIAYADAVFLPSMETAACLLMSAQPMLGENLAVVGQGLIGQLTAAAALLTCPFAHLTIVDIREDRLQQGKAFADETVLPLGLSATAWDGRTPRVAANASEFDVCIEISGSMAGLQSAVDNTLAGGRIITGSWYDTNAGCSLKLDTRFHRSGISVQACQVSRIPAGLSDRWTKARRFTVAWDLIRRVRPSRLLAGNAGSAPAALTASMVDPAAVQSAFEQLDQGAALTALLRTE